LVFLTFVAMIAQSYTSASRRLFFRMRLSV
jgi:hypothetical protein